MSLEAFESAGVPSNVSILDWDYDTVQAFLTSLGYPQYEQQIKGALSLIQQSSPGQEVQGLMFLGLIAEHGISGDILVHLDHHGLKDVGISSVGQRLAILKAVYFMKIRHQVPVEEWHYVPQSEETEQALLDSPSGVIPPKRMFEMLHERDERIQSLESEYQRLDDALSGLREEVQMWNRQLGMTNLANGKARALTARSPTQNTFPHPLSNVATLNRSNSLASQQSHSRSESLQSSAPHSRESSRSGHLKKEGSNSGSGAENGGPSNPSTPLGSPKNYFSKRPDMTESGGGQSIRHQSSSSSLRANASQDADTSIPDITQPNNPPPFPAAVTPLTPTVATTDESHPGTSLASVLTDSRFTNLDRDSQTTLVNSDPPANAVASNALPDPSDPSNRTRSASASKPSSDASTTPLFTSSAITTNATSSRPSASRSNSNSASSASAEARSFRVTLEDPCFKVLPAALKKYKITDDWRQYALFLCHQGVERCLSYDEKPLMLFQRLKDEGRSPVFMLRHMKDIKSPIAVAAAKNHARKEKRAAALAAAAAKEAEEKRDFSRATRLHHPPVLQPVGQDPGRPETPALGEQKGLEGTHAGHLGVAKPSPREASGFCIAIYPYLSEGDDEFDVSVGDCFVILSKAKGWWVVHRDRRNVPSSPKEDVKSGWVPAGCLLETSVPLLATAGPGATTYGSEQPIEPSIIISVSTPSIALMDYRKQGTDELDMEVNDRLMMFKKYNNWSYVVQEKNGSRGWVPAWFLGKAQPSGSGSHHTSSSRTIVQNAAAGGGGGGNDAALPLLLSNGAALPTPTTAISQFINA